MVKIPLSLIDTSGRLRPVNTDRVLLIAAGMAEEGLRVPVEVRPLNKKGRHPLITGGHRFEAARMLEWEEIEAEILDLTPDEAREREINENLYRADLTVLDRGVFLAEKKRLYEKKHPQVRHGGARADSTEQVAIFGDLVPRFTTEVQERLGLSERQIQRLVARAALPERVRSLIAGTPAADSGVDLDALLRLPPDEQIRVAQLMASGKTDAPPSVAAAVRALAGPAPQPPADPAEEQFQTLVKTWRRCTSRRARDRFLEHLAAEGETIAEGQSQ